MFANLCHQMSMLNLREDLEMLRERNLILALHVLDEIDDAVGVAEFVVVP